MPGTITHDFILYKALTSFVSASPLFQEVAKSNLVACKHARANEPEKYLTDEACVLAGCAYLGCFGPDLFYLEFGSKGTFLADLMHYNASGLFLISRLRLVKQSQKATAAGLGRDLLQQFAYYLGHICHIAADICVHPLTNSIVSAYPDNAQAFENARGSLGKNLWKFHNIVEHYADAYVLHRRFYGTEGFARNWETVNIARAAAHYYRNKANLARRFIVSDGREFYRYTSLFSEAFETDKYRFFESDNWILDIAPYFEQTIPDEATMTATPTLVQGGKFAWHGAMLSGGLFDSYVDDAVAMTLTFWGEVERYLAAPQTDYTDATLKEDKKHFPMLRRHWNLDCGLAPTVELLGDSWEVPNRKDTSEAIAGALTWVSSHASAKDDVVV